MTHGEYYAREDGSIGAPRTVAEQQVCTDVPEAPRNVSVNRNIRTAMLHRADPTRQLWFFGMVRNGGPWDYKQRGRRYQAFGNFNYGATGAAAGFSDIILFRAAGAAQVRAGTSRPEWGMPGGDFPYGDDPEDQRYIRRGVGYFRTGCHLVPRLLRD